MMTKRERDQLLEAMRLFRTDDGYAEAMRILRVLTGGPEETAFEKTVREASSVAVSDFFKRG
jgi:hypothetical protein